MSNIAENGLDLSLETTEDLELLLKNEVYMDIDSQFAKDIQSELLKRKENV